jgi:hypothetical protein
LRREADAVWLEGFGTDPVVQDRMFMHAQRLLSGRPITS